MTQRGYQARTRHMFNQDRFTVEFADVPTTRASPVTRTRHALGRKWNKRRVKSRFLGWFPIVTWVREYDLRHELLPDLLTGVTLAVFHVPQSEYARPFCSVTLLTQVILHDTLKTGSHICDCLRLERPKTGFKPLATAYDRSRSFGGRS